VNARPETSPLVLIALHFEGGVDVALGRGAAEDLKRVVAWLSADELRRRIVLDAVELQRRAGVTATDAQLAAIEEELARVPAEPVSPSLEEALRAVCPLGSYQRQPLSRVVAAGEAGRRWIVWALTREWRPADRAFVDALRIVAEAEGLEAPADEHDDEAGTS
jgi:hypothetical protein